MKIHQSRLARNFSSGFMIYSTILQTLNEKRTRLEKYLGHLMDKQRAMNEGIQPLDLSYLLTGRGARRRTTATNVPHLN